MRTNSKHSTTTTTTQKDHQQPTATTSRRRAPQLPCAFCGPHDTHDTSKLFSLGFQSIGICLGCMTDATTGWKSWRWTEKGKPEEPGKCWRCHKLAGRLFLSAPESLPGLGEQIGICLGCIQAGVKHLTNAQNKNQ